MAFLAPLINEQQLDVNGKPLSGGKIWVYLAGTSTPATTYSDKAGLVPNTNPIVLNSLGVSVQGSVWLTGGSAYKFVITDSSGTLQRTIDDVSGVNDTTVTTDQWIVYQGVPTYVSATSFTVPGDQTQIFQVNRRLKSTNTGGTVYSTIKASVYSAPNTTVTLANDSGTLDAGLSAVSYGLISPDDSSLVAPGNYAGYKNLATSQALTAADIGKYLSVSASSLTITLPLGSSVPVGATYAFHTGAAFTISRAGADTISGPTGTGLSSIVMYGPCSIVWRGDVWQIELGGEQVQRANVGYRLAAEGVLDQWGTSVVTLDGSGNGTINWPLAFTSACWTVVACNGDSTQTLIAPVVASFNAAGFVVRFPTAGAISARVNWMSKGI